MSMVRVMDDDDVVFRRSFGVTYIRLFAQNGLFSLIGRGNKCDPKSQIHDVIVIFVAVKGATTPGRDSTNALFQIWYLDKR